jgi:hypothetical protein
VWRPTALIVNEPRTAPKSVLSRARAATPASLMRSMVKPAELARIVQLLVERVKVAPDGLTIRLRTEALMSLVGDLRGGRQARAA